LYLLTAGKHELQPLNVLDRAIHVLDNVGIFSRWINVIGTVIIFLLVGLTFIDVILRYLFSNPITSAFEITEVLLIVAVFFTIAHTQNQKSHIRVDVLTSRLEAKGSLILDFAINLLGTGLFALIVWQTISLTQFFYGRHAYHADSLQWVSWPFAAVIVFGSILMGLLYLRDLLKDVSGALKLNFSWYHWLLMLGIASVLVVLAALWAQKGLWEINLATVGFIGLITFLVFLLAGLPIWLSMLLPAFLFIGHIRGLDTALNMLGRGLYTNTGQFVWATVPFFVLMGYFCLHSRIGEDLYVLVYRWIGHIRGGLAIATTTACTGFAAIVGDSISSIATMTSVAMPQMKKYHYDDRLSTGSIAGGSIIGPIIPPSIPFIVYGVITKVSIGGLFIAGIIPGLLLGLAFAVTVYIWCRINPNVGPAGEKTAWRPRVRSLSASGPILILFVLVIGGIYGGVFSPSEGGAMGAVGALIIGLVMRRFTWRKIWQSALDTAKLLSMLLLIVNGATLFSRFVAWCNVSGVVSDALVGLGMHGLSIVILIFFVFLILGCFVDVLTLTLVGVPIVHPIAVAQGVDPLWFALTMVLVLVIGSLTPPVGINLFTMKGMAPDIPMGRIYRGAFPFVIASIAIIALIIAVPSLVTWLPGTLR
jgi:tripartite ATP-independent transporter DctM subunit